MKRSARFAFSVYQNKPKGLPLAQYPILGLPQPEFDAAVAHDTSSLMYAALVSLGEALRNINEKRSTWSATKLYYSCFYALKCNLYLDNITVFHSGKTEYLLDATTGYTQELGSSSHNFSWNRITNISRLNQWMYSHDSAEAYAALRSIRETANYNNDFTDPAFFPAYNEILKSGTERSFRVYKEDKSFTYTYLQDHRIAAYPVRLTAEAANRFKSKGYSLTPEQIQHLIKLWPFRQSGLW